MSFTYCIKQRFSSLFVVSLFSHHAHEHKIITSKQQNQLKEASQCVQDCQECTTHQELQTEIEAAENSVNVAVACLVDLLDELRVSETEVATDEIVQRIKKLRMDLGELKKQQQLHLDGKGSE